MVILFALVAALGNAIGSVLQRVGVEGARSSAGTDVMTHALRRPVWLLGLVVLTGSFMAQATALHLGALATVEPALVATLPIIALLLWGFFGFDVRPRDAVSCAAAAGGLATFLIVAAPVSGKQHSPASTWVVVGAIVIAFAGLCLLAARNRPAWTRALLMGAASSLGFALTAATTKAATNDLSAGPATFFGSWPVYALVIVGLSSFVLMQKAFRSGPFAASQSSLILVSPFVSIVIGTILFGDAIDTTPIALGVEIPALVVMILGAVWLCTSPLVSGVVDEDDEAAALAGRRRGRARA